MVGLQNLLQSVFRFVFESFVSVFLCVWFCLFVLLVRKSMLLYEDAPKTSFSKCKSIDVKV